MCGSAGPEPPHPAEQPPPRTLEPAAEPPQPSKDLQEPALEAVASTSTDFTRPIITPEEISPFPKAAPRKNKGGKKKGKTLVLTDTPIKEQIRAADEQKKRKNNKQEIQQSKNPKVVKKKCSKKRTLQFNDVVEGDSSNSDEDADENTL